MTGESGRGAGHRILKVLAILAAGGAALLLLVGLVLTRPFPEVPWEEAPPHPVSIYEGGEAVAEAPPGNQAGGMAVGGIPVVSPFHLVSDPMEALLLFNFEADPDRIYVGLEPQAFDDPVHGRGLLVIGWRVDGTVDVFHDPELRLDPAMYGIAGGGLNVMVERSFADAVLELGPLGARVDFRFDDLEGRSIRLLVHETDPRPRTPFGLLAPMGSAAADPPALPLVYVDGFYFVRRAGTELAIEIDGRAHRSDFIPLVLDGTRMHFVRYSTDPFIVLWNPDMEARLRTLEPDFAAPSDATQTRSLTAHADGVHYDLEPNGPFLELRRMSLREAGHEAVISFAPALPHLLALVDGAEVTGAFRITAQPGVGTVSGGWQVVRRGGEIHLELEPDGGWTPGPAPRMARLLFRAVSIFRDWPTTYRWSATIDLPPSGTAGDDLSAEPPGFQSGWERTGP
jgi:hypothetical protein